MAKKVKKNISKPVFQAVYENGYLQRELISHVIIFLNKYLRSVLNGENPGTITMELRADTFGCPSITITPALEFTDKEEYDDQM